MNNVNIALIIALAILGFFFQCIFIYIESKKKYIPAVFLKGSASLCFLSVGIVAFINSINKVFSTLVLTGLILGLVGDVLLNLRFVFKKNSNVIFLGGTASFLFGHILYIIALFKIAEIKFIYAPLITSFAILFIVGYFIFKVLKVKNGMKIFGCIYILIVSLFMSVAIYNLASVKSNLTILTSVGSMLFFASDVILIFNSFGEHPRLSLRASNLLLYFVGQILIATSLLFI